MSKGTVLEVPIEFDEKLINVPKDSFNDNDYQQLQIPVPLAQNNKRKKWYSFKPKNKKQEQSVVNNEIVNPKTNIKEHIIINFP